MTDIGTVLIFVWVVGVMYTFGHALRFCTKQGLSVFSMPVIIYSAACWFIWPVLLGFLSKWEEQWTT